MDNLEKLKDVYGSLDYMKEYLEKLQKIYNDELFLIHEGLFVLKLTDKKTKDNFDEKINDFVIDKSFGKTVSTSIGNTTINVNIIQIGHNKVPTELFSSIKALNHDTIEQLKDFVDGIINPSGFENISHLIDDDKKVIKYFNDRPSNTFKELLNDIHTLKENRNFSVPNVNLTITSTLPFLASSLSCASSSRHVPRFKYSFCNEQLRNVNVLCIISTEQLKSAAGTKCPSS